MQFSAEPIFNKAYLHLYYVTPFVSDEWCPRARSHWRDGRKSVGRFGFSLTLTFFPIFVGVVCVVFLASALCCCFATYARIALRCRHGIVYYMLRTPSVATTLACLIFFSFLLVSWFLFILPYFFLPFVCFRPLLFFFTSGGGTLGSGHTRHTLAAGAGLLGRRDTGAGREERSRNSLPPPGESPQEERLPQAPHIRHQQGSFSFSLIPFSPYPVFFPG